MDTESTQKDKSTTSFKLTQEQYELLARVEPDFDSLERLGYCRNLDRSWLESFRELYKAIYSEHMRIDCLGCVRAAMGKIRFLMKNYEQEKETRE